MRDRPFPQRHTTLRHRDFTRAPSQPAQVQPSPPDQNPRLFNKWIILWGAEKCCRNVTAVRYDRRARRVERVVRDFVGIGVRTESRRSRTYSPDAREGYRGRLRKLTSQPALYRDHQPPNLRKYPHFRPPSSKSEFCPSGHLDRQIWRSDGPGAATSRPQPPSLSSSKSCPRPPPPRSGQ